jgi:hypothetical protein
MPKLTKAPAVIHISAKCSDLFFAAFADSAGVEVANYSGYVPGFMPGEHYGDYVQLDIDLATGRILNWKKPSLAAINSALNDSDQ